MMLLVSTVLHVCSQSHVIALEDITEGCACSSSGQSEERQEITYYRDLVTKDAQYYQTKCSRHTCPYNLHDPLFELNLVPMYNLSF